MHRKCGKSKALAQRATQKKSHTEPRELKRHSHLLEADGNFATDLVETDSHPHCLRGCFGAEHSVAATPDKQQPAAPPQVLTQSKTCS